MDRLFSTRKKRAPSDVERPSTLKKQPSSAALGEGSLSQKRQAVKEAFSGDRKGKGRGAHGSEDKAPSLNIDIRNSLILPGLSQRFSVLLPSLSSAPESSIRSLLASQRARPDGPSLTEEEEELLFAEIRDSAKPWNEEFVSLTRAESSGVVGSGNSGNYRYGGLSTSTSSPSILSITNSDGPTSAPIGTSSSWNSTPPPTSTSFSSFHTFGVSESNVVKTKSYGFSGGSSLRDVEYIRKVKKSGSGNTLDPSFQKKELDTLTSDNTVAELDHEDPAFSDPTASPVTAVMHTVAPHPDPTDQPSLKPSSRIHPPPTPDSAEFRPYSQQRQSLLVSLTPAQVKRISLALGELEGKLTQPGAFPLVAGEDSSEEVGDEEETLQPMAGGSTSEIPLGVSDTSPGHFTHYPTPPAHSLKSSFVHPQSSSRGAQKSEPPSPSRLPPSPKSLNLRAQVEESQPTKEIPVRSDVPRPILTPSRTQPVRHKPSISVSGHSSPPVYVPGQPRPVGSMHRSDGSMSSRSGTPTILSSPSPAFGSSTPTPNRVRSDSNPSPSRQTIAPRTSSLGKSLSSTQRAGNIPNDKSSSLRGRLQDQSHGNSSLDLLPGGIPADPIQEEAEPNEEMRRNNERLLKKAADESKAEASQNSVPVSYTQIQDETRRNVVPLQSASDYVELNRCLSSSPILHGRGSSDSIASDFAESVTDLKWDKVLASPMSDLPVTPADESGAAEMLRKLSGVGSEELLTLQMKLVEKAKLERIALRGGLDTSPPPIFSPTLSTTTLPSRSPNLEQAPARMLHALRPAQEVHELVILASSTTSRLGEGITSSTSHTLPRRAAPSPPDPVYAVNTPSETNEELVFTPTSTNVIRKSSRRIAPEDDPDVRRDFEARIAAATAALNRTPTTASASLRRKNTKKGVPIAISSPTLLSSSTKLIGAPVTTPDAIDSSTAKALETTSGSGSKMSMRWRKLGFRRGPSVSNNHDFHTPTTDSSSSRLEEPISLRDVSPLQDHTAPLESKSPDLKSFRFPVDDSRNNITRSKSTKADPSTGLRHMMGKMRRGKSDEKVLDRLDNSAVEKDMTHTSSVSAHTTDIESNKPGKIPDLNEDPSGERCVTKVHLQQLSSLPQGSVVNLPTPNNNANTSQDIMSSIDIKAAASMTRLVPDATKAALRPSGVPKPAEEVLPRKVIVRRTLLVPTEGSTPTQNSIQPSAYPSVRDFESPDPSGGPPGQGHRKLSIKRKPLNLTREDQFLVQSSSPPHSRKVSVATTSSAISEGRTENVGLGFLHPPILRQSTSSIEEADHDRTSMQRSSAGGSLYDLYGDNASYIGGQELLGSPTKIERRSSEQWRAQTRRSTQAVEITEYADGRLVWSLVDALRDDDAEGVVFEAYPQPHSRTASFGSSNPDSVGEVSAAAPWDQRPLGGATSGLKFRHRDRNANTVRPPTNVYYTSSADVADLIDHLSHDLDASRGRIDILPTIKSTGNSPTDGTLSMVSGQFEDAPSPRKGPPTPIGSTRGLVDDPHRIHLKGLGSMKPELSPSASSFASSVSGAPGRTVEDRLQALLDKLKNSGVRAQEG